MPESHDSALSVRSLSDIPEESVWLANYMSSQTRRTYRDSIRGFVAFHNMRTLEDLRSINAAHIIAWRDSMMKGGASDRTVHSKIAAVSSLFMHLCERQLVKTNPTLGVRRPKVSSFPVKAVTLTREQVRRLLATPDVSTLPGLRDASVLYILFYTGCRISEVASLRVKDLYEDGGYTILDFTVKGGKRNKVAIHQELHTVLKAYLAMAGHGEDKEAPLIKALGGAAGGPLHSRQLSNIFQRYAKRSGLPEGVAAHSARATFITLALERGCPIEAVQRSVGHSHISTTQMYDKRGVRLGESASFAVEY